MHRINNQISSTNIRLIGEDSKQIGIISIKDAIRMAQEKGLDLVEISGNISPPVCRILDYSKYTYEEKQKQKEKERLRRQTQIKTKEVVLNSVIQDGDLQIKIRNIKRMLDDGDKVRVIIKFAGRQIRHLEIGDDLFNKVLAQLPGVLLESRSGLEGKKISITISNMENKKLE